MTKLLLWGAGGHGKVVLDCAESMGAFDDIAFLDDACAIDFCGHPVLGDRTVLSASARRGYTGILISIGDNATRAACFTLAAERGLSPTSIIHSCTTISPSASVGPGTVVMPGCVINADARIGANCILNTAAVIEHDCIIGDHVHISPRVVLGGGVRVGVMAHIGIGAIALPGVTIGDRAVVGAGCVVLRSVDPATTVVGVPARVVTRVQL